MSGRVSSVAEMVDSTIGVRGMGRPTRGKYSDVAFRNVLAAFTH